MTSFKVYLMIVFNTLISSFLMINLTTLLFDDFPNKPVNLWNFKTEWKSVFNGNSNKKEREDEV